MTEQNNELKTLESLARFAEQKSVIRYSRFLDPAEQEQAQKIAETHKISSFAWGGFDEAERKMICYGPAGCQPPEGKEYPLSCLMSACSQKYEKVTHRDILGAFMSLGLTRSCLGDIIIHDTSVFIFVTNETSLFVMDSLKEAKRVKLAFHPVQDTVMIPKPKGTYFRAVTSSMRLDAVLAAACHLSRSKACDCIRSGSVKLNHIECLQPDQEVEAGSILSVRNMGRIKLVSFDGETKKERLGLTFFQFE